MAEEIKPDRIRLNKIVDYLKKLPDGQTLSYNQLGREIDMAPETVHRIVGAWMTQTIYDTTTSFIKSLSFNGPDEYCWLFFEHITEINKNKHARKFFLKEGTIKDKTKKLFRR